MPHFFIVAETLTLIASLCYSNLAIYILPTELLPAYGSGAFAYAGTRPTTWDSTHFLTISETFIFLCQLSNATLRPSPFLATAVNTSNIAGRSHFSSHACNSGYTANPYYRLSRHYYSALSVFEVFYKTRYVSSLSLLVTVHSKRATQLTKTRQ